MSVRQDIIAALKTRLEGIAKVSGYQTDIGKALYIGEAPTLGPDDPTEFCVLVIGDADTTHNMMNIGADLLVEVHACCKVADSDNPWLTVEAAIADVEKAIEIDTDLALGKRKVHDFRKGNTRPLEREDGSEYVGASVAYQISYTRAWGTP